MPSGYTADLYEGKEIDFATFTMQCARAFGAMVTLRDEPMSADVPDLVPSMYHYGVVFGAKARLAEIAVWTDEHAQRLADKEYDEQIAYRAQDKAKRDKLVLRYDTMLLHVNAWTPPTSEHEKLKSFMIDQLVQSREFDCKMYERSPVERQTAAEYKAAQVAEAEHDIEYHTEKHERELELAHSRNMWIQDLVRSLKEL